MKSKILQSQSEKMTTQLYSKTDILKLLDHGEVDRSLVDQGYSKELYLDECGEDSYKQEIINYYINNRTIKMVVENGKGCKISYYFNEEMGKYDFKDNTGEIRRCNSKEEKDKAVSYISMMMDSHGS